ncbi:hypothetical protein TrLO_g10903 [Triparma laevis f. longispina]|uniref:Uncharacterized protein n=1 Tax=Triparma laevis f. longispina TaxID=1714387 RepID=A0A9W7CCN5_9STRA|nr:hypothetical protein TrLO_g10903 [Triparma laevis f. longispina]
MSKSTLGRVRKQAVIPNIRVETIKKKAKKSTKKNDEPTTCEGPSRSPCGECPSCFDSKKPTKKKCWMIKHGLEGPVERDGATVYCCACGYEEEEDGEGEEVEGGEEVDVDGDDEEEEEDEDPTVPVPGDHLLLCDGMTLGDNCPRSWHVKCVLPASSIVSPPGLPVLYLKPSGSWLCPWHVAKENNQRPPISKKKKAEKEKEIAAKKKSTQTNLNGLIIKKPKTVVKVKTTSCGTDLEELKRNPEWISCLSILYLLKEELRITFTESKALKGAFPIRELEVAFSSLTSAHLSDFDYSILSKKLNLSTADSSTLSKFYSARSYDLINEAEDFALGEGLLNLVMHRLLLTKTKRKAYKKDECTPRFAKGMEEWYPMLRSRVIMWYCLLEANKTFIVDRNKGEELDESESTDEPSSSSFNVVNPDLCDEAVSSLKRLLNLNTNISGGSGIFKSEMSVLEMYLAPDLRPRLGRGEVEVVEEEDVKMDVEEEEGDEEKEDDVSNLTRDEIQYRALKHWCDITNPSSVFTRPYLTLLTPSDFSNIEKTIQTWTFIATENLEQEATNYAWLVDALPEDLLADLLKEGTDFTDLKISTKIKVFKALCESTLLLDQGCIDELHLFDAKDLRDNFTTPLCFDAFGRAYFYNESLQPAMACRIYRTVASYGRPGKHKMMELAGGDVDCDPLNGWEIVAENEKDLERLLKSKDIFNSDETKVLKEKLEYFKGQVILEKEQVSKLFEREKKKAILAAMPRRTSSRRGGGTEGEDNDVMTEEYIKSLGLT